MEPILLIVICILLLIAIILIIVFRNKSTSSGLDLQNKVLELQGTLSKIEANLKEDFRTNREENSAISKDNRTELNNTLKDFKTELSSSLNTITEQNHNALKDINKILSDKVEALITKVDDNNKVNRETLTSNLKDFTLEQRKKFDDLKNEQTNLTTTTVEQLDKINSKVEVKLTEMNKSVGEKIETLVKKVEENNKTNREELANSLRQFMVEQREKFDELEKQQNDLTTKTVEQLDKVNTKVEVRLTEMSKTMSEKIDTLVTKVDDNNKTNRETLSGSLKDFTLEQRNKFDELKVEQKDLTTKTGEQLEKINGKVEEKLTALAEQAKTDSVQQRDSLINAFKGFQETFDKNIQSFNDLQKEKFAAMDVKQNELVRHTESKLEHIRVTVEEKLEKTLSDRLGQSFETVGKQLIEVQKGLGEMQILANDVGGLKRVLTNVKMRGGFGEVQLHMLLESILAPDQYEANVATKKNSKDRVEYAVKFPNKEGHGEFVWLPIDAKFPKEAYESLQTAHDTADVQLIEQAQKVLESVIKKMARDICEKYIDVPNTTNFGIMFLPFEGLFAEVVRKASLLEQIQRECNVVITGPTTLAVILNSLQMGFRTLAIQKRSGEVWQILSGVKKEFNTFGGLINKAQNYFQKGIDELDTAVGVRTRAIQRQLRGVETLKDADVSVQVADVLKTELPEDKIINN